MNSYAENRKEWVFKQRRELLKMFVPSQNKFRKLLDKANVLYVRERPIWLYSKESKRIYSFNNILDLQRSVCCDVNKVFGVLQKELKSNFYVSFDKKELAVLCGFYVKKTH